jgi:opacity protein-like surface antigen
MLKKFLVISIIIIFVLPFASSANMGKNLPSKKAWALQFSIGHSFTLSSFQGSSISILKHTSLKKAWRYGVTIGASTNNTDDKDIANNIRTGETETDNSSVNFTLDIIRITYPNSSEKVNLFYGIGPTMTYNSTRNEYQRKIPTIDNRISTRTTWNLGGRVILGVQYFVAKNIGLLAEYGSSFTYNYNRDKQEILSGSGDTRSYRIDDRKSNGVSFSSSVVKFGLSAYF